MHYEDKIDSAIEICDTDAISLHINKQNTTNQKK